MEDKLTLQKGSWFEWGAMVEDGTFRVDKLDDEKWQWWKLQMEDYVYQKYLYLTLRRKSNKLTSMTDEVWDVL